MASVPSDDLLASVLARAEIEGGMRASERARVASLSGALRLLPPTDAVARRAGEHLRRSRPGVDLVDHVVAATAELHGATLATPNVRRFPTFRGSRPPR